MDYRVLNLEEGEDVIYEVRRHWIVFFGYGFGLLVAVLLPFVVLILIANFIPKLLNLSISGNLYALFSFLYIIWVLTLWMSFFMDWTKYYLDVWFVTEKRIIIVDQKRLFDRQVSNIRFDRVQDVSVDIDGVVATFLDFGNIKVQTASEDNTEFTLTTVRHPEEVRRVIFSQHNTISDRKDSTGVIHN